jgi:CcmD family protein
MRRLLSILGISLALLAPAALRAQAPDTTATSAAAVAEVPSGSGLPERAGPPRTLRAYWHVFAAFAIAWILLFGYALSLGRRFANVERELRRLGENA